MYVLSRLLIVWKFMLMNNRMFVEGYRVAITNERMMTPTGVSFPHTLCFWCLNPQVRAASVMAVTCSRMPVSPVSSQCRSRFYESMRCAAT